MRWWREFAIMQDGGGGRIETGGRKGGECLRELGGRHGSFCQVDTDFFSMDAPPLAK